MRIFLPVAAVAVGLADALLYSAFGDSPQGGPFVWNIEPGPQVAAHMISAVVSGLIVSGALLLFADRWLRGSFFARYLLMWAAICAGGAILGVLLHGSILPLDERGPTPQGLEILFHIAFPAAAGGIFGIFEGAYPGLPLAWLLGLFGSPAPVRDGQVLLAAFVRVSAVLVGMANVFLVSLIGEGELGNAFMQNLDPWWPHNAVYALLAAVAGLVVSSIFPRFARHELHGTFFARYGVMVLAVCLGGVVLALFLAYPGVWLYSSPITTAERLLGVSSGLPLTIGAAGALGAAEGVVLAFPLAAVLGRPGTEH